MKILVLGSSGMLGYSLFKNLSDKSNLDIYGTIRNKEKYKDRFTKNEFNKILELDVLEQANEIKEVISHINPNYVINCIGAISQKESEDKNLIYLNSFFPHVLKENCDASSVKLIHFSTDCVFNGKKGNYSELDLADAHDLYGRSKYLGEVKSKNHLTIRTSIIGHELSSNMSLVNWFLNEKEKVRGYKNAVFSGFPCVYISEILSTYIFNNRDLGGVMHIAANPINKYDLLSKIAKVYKKNIEIEEYEDYKSDKSLNSSKFNKMVKFSPPEWDKLILLMNEEYRNNFIK